VHGLPAPGWKTGCLIARRRERPRAIAISENLRKGHTILDPDICLRAIFSPRARNRDWLEILVDQASGDHSLAQLLSNNGKPGPERGDESAGHDPEESEPSSVHDLTLFRGSCVPSATRGEGPRSFVPGNGAPSTWGASSALGQRRRCIVPLAVPGTRQKRICIALVVPVIWG
jgi:hypothetical protein